MKIATALIDGERTTAIMIDDERGAVPVADVLGGSFADAGEVVRRVSYPDLKAAAEGLPDAVFKSPRDFVLSAPYRNPRLIWGIGLNFRQHATDLSATPPADEPASFIKGDHTVIGPGEPIPLPRQSRRVTAEAEIGLVIGREARHVSEAEALEYVWGVVPVLDQTAEDILMRNPRYLTRSKNFPGFFSFGPWITPTEEVLRRIGDPGDIRVATVINGKIHREDHARNMIFGLAQLVSFHSDMMPLYPGDLLSTGTPGAVEIQPGDVVTCRIEGIGELSNPVVAGGR